MLRTSLLLLVLLLSTASSAQAQVAVPNTFTYGTPAVADEVNANFTALVDAVNTELANRATDCVGAGGSWDAGTSTCAPKYNCLLGGFCSQVAIFYPQGVPAGQPDIINYYAGHTASTGECHVYGSEGNWLWRFGRGCNSLTGECLNWEVDSFHSYMYSVLTEERPSMPGLPVDANNPQMCNPFD